MIGWIFRVNMIGTFAQQQQLNMVHQFMLMSGNTPLTFSECVTDLGEVVAEYLELWATIMSVQVSWFGYSVASLDGAEVSGIVPFTAPIEGEVTATDALPSQTALVLRYATGYSRRTLRKFVPGMVEGQTTATGQWTSAVLSSAIFRGATLLTPLEGTEAAWQYMYKTPNTALAPLIVFPIGVTASATPYVMRSRRLQP